MHLCKCEMLSLMIIYLFYVLPGNRELDSLLKSLPTDIPSIPDKKEAVTKPGFTLRDEAMERAILFDLFNSGVDEEDLQYFNKCYDKMLSNDDEVMIVFKYS